VKARPPAAAARFESKAKRCRSEGEEKSQTNSCPPTTLLTIRKIINALEDTFTEAVPRWAQSGEDLLFPLKWLAGDRHLSLVLSIWAPLNLALEWSSSIRVPFRHHVLRKLCL